jgi:hypothetical protein
MTHIPKAFCIDCEEEMRCEEKGFVVLTQTKDKQNYYKIRTDVYACNFCENRIALTSRETTPILRHEDGFDSISPDCVVRFR